jgi:hypothetical protein
MIHSRWYGLPPFLRWRNVEMSENTKNGPSRDVEIVALAMVLQSFPSCNCGMKAEVALWNGKCRTSCRISDRLYERQIQHLKLCMACALLIDRSYWPNGGNRELNEMIKDDAEIHLKKCVVGDCICECMACMLSNHKLAARLNASLRESI